jgi:hypothetical protein
MPERFFASMELRMDVGEGCSAEARRAKVDARLLDVSYGWEATPTVPQPARRQIDIRRMFCGLCARLWIARRKS